MADGPVESSSSRVPRRPSLSASSVHSDPELGDLGNLDGNLGDLDADAVADAAARAYEAACAGMAEEVEEELETAPRRAPTGRRAVKPPSKPTAPKPARTGAARAGGRARTPAGSATRATAGGRRRERAGLDAPSHAFSADVRSAARAGSIVWCAERDGCLVLRDARTAETMHRLLCAPQQLVWCVHAVGSGARAAVWAGTESGPILRYGASSRELLAELHRHAGGVHCLASSKRSHFVLSGARDRVEIAPRFASRGRYRRHGL